ncbi:MAG: 2-amino-4-hydroxy-6-hydroxymethyldihydropteridine diphosphokinase [Deltaproteobacteria bacterium]|nr:2-amino-4-hydroxy-6-hydroxymethyldihydropteridine diphosphokinase [Deltaproteobacteria bacterium]
MGIGSNLGDSRTNCIEAIKRLRKVENLRIKKISSLYLTSPVGFDRQNDFLNCVVLLEYLGAPRMLLEELKKIEKEMGRFDTIKWGPRIIDLDILLFDNKVINDEDLKIPHPELHKRRFALVPLIELNRDLTHPVFGRKLREFLPEIEKSQKIKFLGKISFDEIGISDVPGD